MGFSESGEMSLLDERWREGKIWSWLHTSLEEEKNYRSYDVKNQFFSVPMSITYFEMHKK